MHTSMSSLSKFTLVLVLANVVSGQTTTPTATAPDVELTGTASIMPFPPADDGVQGQVIGTGEDGTTYRIFGTLGGLGNPFTATLVQDASQLSEIAEIETEGVIITLQASCSFSDSAAECVQNIIGGGTTLATSLTLPQDFTAVPIVSGTEEPTLTGESSASESGSESVLPPVISTSSTGTGGVTAGPGTATVVSGAPSEATDADSGAERVSGFMWALALPIFGSWLVW